ncbi:midasin-like, partial [Nylanderia fulva]|uniref:midasin-like n=1 Tax=Nylanderia fulva TaxID=613905 RepID=UPI0010FBA67D
LKHNLWNQTFFIIFQTDYNRHLEQLFERVTALLIDSLRTKITIDNLKQVIELHKHLEQVRDLFDENVTGKTMAAESELFLNKIEELSKLISAMKFWELAHESKLRDIEFKLENLSIFVKKDKCLNAGGKFEWVDSILVKCLQDGTWLLIDQVNLCSPAVLDRLNGLLEPNGVLSIGERGVDSEGNVITIKPHENFRLFLTMDPRYGEISRAMRNRGVEIYMFGPKENIYDDAIDLKSLLFNAGIAKSTHRDALLKIYETMSKDVIAVDRFSVVDLLHTAFLAKQRLLRGFSAERSIRNACIDVYIKARPMRDPQFREHLISLIDEIIERHGVADNQDISLIDLEAATWSVKNLQDNSRLAIIRQQSLLLKAVVKLYELGANSRNERNIVASKLFNKFCGLKDEEEYILNVGVTETLPYFLLHFYEQSSQDDALLRKKWISKMLRGNAIFDELKKQSALMANVIALFRFRSPNQVKNLPWDFWQLVGRMTHDEDDSTCNDANKLLLLLYAHSMIFKSDVTKAEILQNKDVISVKQYSSIVHDGELSSQLKNQPLITYFAQFIERANSYIAMILRDSDISVNPEEYVELRRELKWYTRFEKLGETTLINKKRLKNSTSRFTDVEQISSLLKVHYKWLLKFLRKLSATTGQFPNEKTASEIELWEIVSQVNNQLDSVYDPIKKISKRVKKYLTLPPPHSSEVCMKVHSELRRLTNDFNIRNEEGMLLLKQELKIIFMELKDALMMRHHMISLWSDVHLRKPIEETSIIEVEQFCEESHIRLRVSTEVESVLNRVHLLPKEEMTQMNARIQLWPIHEYVFMSFAWTLQAEMCREGMISAATLTECLARFADIPGIPSDLIGLLNAMTRTEIEHPQKLLLLPELFFRLAQFARKSRAVRSTNRFLHWRGITEEDMERSLTSYAECKTECYFGGAVLLNLVLQLMLNKINGQKERKNILSTVALGTYKAQMDQLQLLNEILWRNSISLTNKQYYLISSDLITLKFYLCLYSSAIDKMNAENDLSDLIANVIKKEGESNATAIKNKLQTDYLQPVEEFHKACNEINKIDETSIDEKENLIRQGRAWMLLGYLQLLLFGNLDQIDPVYKVELKVKYLEEDYTDCRRTIYVTSLQNRILGLSTETEHIHPRLVATKNCEQNLLKTKDKLSCLKAFRSPSANFALLSKDCVNFRNQIGSYKVVEKHMNNLCAIASEISQECKSADLLSFNTVLDEAEIWSLSVQGFAEQIEAKYLSVYPDVILPLLAALAQLSHGVNILINEIRRRISLRANQVSDLEALIYNLIRFPTIGQGQESLLNLSDLCISRSTRNLVGNSDAFVRMQEQFQIFKSGLHELHNHVILNRGLTKSLWRDANELLQQIVLIWKQQQQEEERRAAERDSLYKNKIERHGDTLTEEEELALEVHKLFPTSRERDFHDIEDGSQFSLEQNNALQTESNDSESTFSGLITKDDIKEIQEIHSDIVTSFIASKWICSSSTSVRSTDYVDPLIQRYNTVYGMLDLVLPSLNEEFAMKLYNSLNLLVTLGLQATQEKSSDRILRENTGVQTKAYDFYKECNIEEARQCLPLCEKILIRVNQLLDEWPEQPSLKSIRCIIERIYTFPITSPVSRFLTGLELLLVKMKQWEDNAHSGVSMGNYISALTQQIISWRKLELSSWKGCLNATYENLRSNTSKWWFFLYALIESYITRSNDESVTRESLVESLERFMTESSLVEFESRLNLLWTFHCHVYYFDDSDVKNELLAVLWNVYNYYKQFVDDVNARIAALRAPIKKKLEDYVKIARWNDINYWAVKETVDKTHRTLHKYAKEFQNALKQSVSSCLIVKSGSYSTEMNKGIWDAQDHHKYILNLEEFIVEKPPQSIEIETRFTSGHITKADTLLKTARNLCKKIIQASSYPHIRSDLENFVMSFMEQSARLRDLDIDRSLPKSKQKSQAKSILQQKRMTLANYFKSLTRMGVSYRTGALTWKNNADKVIDYTVSPLDLSAIGRYFKLRSIDQQMLAQWQGCEKYYYKSLIRLNALHAMLSTNQTDLGPQNMERCRGYSAHLMLMAHRQKTTLARSFDRFSSLRIQISNLSEMREQDLNVSKQRDGQDCARSLKTLLITLEAGFEQLLLCLQCCPAESLDSNRAVLTLNANALPIISASRTDEVWKSATTLLEDSLRSIKTTAKRFHALFVPFEILLADHSEDSIHALLSSKHFEFLEQSHATIEDLRARARELKQLFGSSDVMHPIWENIAFLDMKMECFLRNYDENLGKSVEIEGQLKEDSNAVEKYELALEHLINTILLTIQKKYKDRNLNDTVTQKPSEENDENDKDEEEEIDENELNERLVEFLERDITELKLSKVSNSFFSLLLSIREFDLQSANYCIRLLLKCLPLLEQYLLFAQFYLNEQVASFRITCKMLYLQLNVFLDLAANGFCVPKDLDLEEGETDESGEKTGKGGMGLADGEGTKDVSDQIESEDQLEDARPADQEQEKQDDKTCKEEEKGIDMSEDFDSKPQDMEKDEDDEERSDDDENNDLDKEMGETGEGAEQLDKEIWGDDNEESEEDDQEKLENDDEEEGTGERIGEKEMGAKDDEKKRKQHDDDDTNDNKNREEENKKEINELNEPEIDEDQINPYHGKFQPQPEPEQLDLPEDINLDEGEENKEDNGEEENPFDIDEMKDFKPPQEKMNDELEKEAEENKENDPEEESSEDENGENTDLDGQKTQEELESNQETKETNEKNAETENKDEEQNRDEEAEEKLQETAAPSADDASKQMDAAEQVEETTEGSRDTVAQQSDQAKDQQEASAENTEEDSKDNGTGQSESAQQESGHSGSSKQETIPASQKNIMTKSIEKRKNPGKSHEDRSLLDKFQPALKKLKTIYTQDEISKEPENDPGNTEGDEAEMAKHVKDSEKFDDYTLDAATEDQVKQQASNMDKEENQEEKKDDATDVEMHEDEENNVSDNKIEEQRPENISETPNDKRKRNFDSKRNNIENNQETTVELEGETAETMKIQRGNETTFHTMEWNMDENNLDSGYTERKRFEVEKMLAEWTQIPSTEEAAIAWNCLCSVTDTAARDLSEKLRLVLEPTQASRLRGDYKTGKRINMRKIIPYIASQFRKDKIWLRRTKPFKRDYQIVLALDDSSSMADNHSKELAFESLSLISKAMTYLEVGQLSVVSFGEQVKMLHPLGEAFTEQTGSRLIQEVRFDQRKTMVGQLVNSIVEIFENQCTSSDSAKLLVVLSDGRGIFSEGTKIVNNAIRRAKLADIFLVFIVVDNPINKDSILDIRTPIFEGNKFLGFRSYMDNFPFPFYIILRDINSLPGVLSDALRQWFEVVGKVDT